MGSQESFLPPPDSRTAPLRAAEILFGGDAAEEQLAVYATLAATLTGQSFSFCTSSMARPLPWPWPGGPWSCSFMVFTLFGSCGNSQILRGNRKLAGVAVGNLDELTLLTLSADVLLQNNFHNVFLLMTPGKTPKTENAGL